MATGDIIASGLPTAGGVPSYTGNLIPVKFAANLLAFFYLATVFGAIANTDYTGEIKNSGDHVIIRQLPTITISNYSKGGGFTAENPNPAAVDLYINKAKSYSVNIWDVDQAQSDMKFWSDWGTHAGELMKVAVDNDILANIYSSVHAKNHGATAGNISSSLNLGATGAALTINTPALALTGLMNAGQVLDEQNIPRDGGRWAVVTPGYWNLLLQSDLKAAYLTGDKTSPLRNGEVGMINDFTVYKSNNYTAISDSGSKLALMFGHKVGLTFASQLTKNEIKDMPTDFGKIMAGLILYGYKVTKSDALGYIYATLL
jgi:hypothetical protein